MAGLRPFDEIFALAAERKGGAAAFEATLPEAKSPAELVKIADDRWLSTMSKCVFQAGFNWKVVDTKWPDFEDVFQGFDLGRMAFMSDDDLDRYLGEKRIIRHGKKILSIRDNAIFLQDLAREHGSAGQVFANWPADDFAGLLWMLKKRGSRLGGATGMVFLRFMGVDGFLTSRDVVRALIRDGAIDKEPSSKKDLDAVQAAFNLWRDQSGRGLTQISRILASSIA